MITLIAAVSENNIIGKNNKIPWYIPEDMKHFKELTINHPVIMGRKTYLSIPEKFRPLPKRKNIVMSKTLEPENGIYLAKNVEEALNLTEESDVYIMGGGEIYNIFLPQTNKMELTRVHQEFEGDAFFPTINWDEWSLIKSEERMKTKEGLEYSFLTYERK